MGYDKKLLVSGMIDSLNRLKRLNWRHVTNCPIKHSEMMLLFNLKKYLPSGSPGLKTSEISGILRLAPPTVTPLINSLEEAGYIERLQDKSDRRVVLIKTTPKGDKLVEQAKEEVTEAIDKLVEYLGEDDSNEMVRLLEKSYHFLSELVGKQK
jgi:DNA-binding MarR family transcriptional regulator